MDLIEGKPSELDVKNKDSNSEKRLPAIQGLNEKELEDIERLIIMGIGEDDKGITPGPNKNPISKKGTKRRKQSVGQKAIP